MHDPIAESLERFLQEYCSPVQVRKYEQGAALVELWRELTALGFADALLPEDAGGSALGLAQIRGLVVLLGRSLLPVPLAETMVARALLHGAGETFPSGPIVLASPSRIQAGWSQAAVASAHTAEFVLAEMDGRLVLMALASLVVTRTGVHGSFAAHLRWPKNARPLATIECAPVALRVFGATLRAAQMLGSMECLLDLTLEYAHGREQFGRAIEAFQAVQQQLAVMAEHLLAASIAVEMAFSQPGIVPHVLCAAVAKQRTSEAASHVAAIAHAVHGAIGLCEEYNLQLHVRRLYEWRLADGSAACWSQMLGAKRLAAAGNCVDFIREQLTPAHS